MNVFNTLHGTTALHTLQRFFAMLPALQATDHYNNFSFDYQNIIVFRFQKLGTKAIIKDMNELYDQMCACLYTGNQIKVGAAGFFDHKKSKLGKKVFRSVVTADQGHLVVFPRSMAERNAITSFLHALTPVVDNLQIINHYSIAKNLTDLLIKLNFMFEADGFGKHSWLHEPVIFPCKMRSLDAGLTTTHSPYTNAQLSRISPLLTAGITKIHARNNLSYRNLINSIFCHYKNVA